MELKLPFGMKNGKLVQVSEIESGLKCNCNCPACNHPLVARKGNKTIHHFAHHKRSDCQYSLETSLHIASKNIIESSGYIILPKLKDNIFHIRQVELSSQTKLVFDKIYLEKKFNDFVPDIIIEKNKRLLCIEIYVTHQVDEQKIQKLKNSKISTIEIDLSKNERQIDFEILKELVVDSVENKKWLFNVKHSRLHHHIISNSHKKMIINRGLASHVDGCPLPARIWKGKPYANFTDDCLGCEYFIVPETYKDDNTFYCIGHKTEEEIKKLIVL
jgi:hypothetical protein